MTTRGRDADDVVVRFLIDRKGLLDTVLREHVDDGRGDCRACPDLRAADADSRATSGASRIALPYSKPRRGGDG